MNERTNRRKGLDGSALLGNKNLQIKLCSPIRAKMDWGNVTVNRKTKTDTTLAIPGMH